MYLILAGVERLLIEQIRVNPVFNLGGVHATQAEIIAVTLIALGLIGMMALGQRVPAARLHNNKRAATISGKPNR